MTSGWIINVGVHLWELLGNVPGAAAPPALHLQAFKGSQRKALDISVCLNGTSPSTGESTQPFCYHFAVT